MVVVAAFCPSGSWQNKAELRMSRLSFEVAGMVFDPIHYGNHLNASKETRDAPLELQNYEYIGNVLASVWTDIDFDGHPIAAKYIPPPQDGDQLPEERYPDASEEFLKEHLV